MSSTDKSNASLHMVIKQVPLNSSIPHRLISAMDIEIESLYPDAADFPYAGRGNWLTGAMPVPALDQNPDATANEVSERADKEDAETSVLVAFVQPQTALEPDQPTTSPAPEEAIGCVGIRLVPDFASQETTTSATPTATSSSSGDSPDGSHQPVTAEIKRMYVEPAYRGKLHNLDIQGSVSAALLAAAESYARDELSARRLVLETGMRQLAAMALYQKNGWEPRPTYRDYIGAGEDVGGLSRCFEKWVA